LAPTPPHPTGPPAKRANPSLVDVDAFVRETREIIGRERAEADARTQRAAAQAAAEHQVTTDNTSSDELFAMMWPAAVRERRDEAVDVDA
jgi:hypothetical protein